ncbi:MAG: hypothetical protein GY704_00935 [Phycisphaeraceae bacterium]|nr:hypothetical protein [Phycisphaeraceae bacterium]
MKSSPPIPLSLPGAMPYAVPAPQFDRIYGSVGFGVRSSVWGMDVLAGSTMSVGQKEGAHASTYLTLGKRF